MTFPQEDALASIIIPCWNQLAFTRLHFLLSFDTRGGHSKFIVLENSSTDGTAAYLAGFQDGAPTRPTGLVWLTWARENTSRSFLRASDPEEFGVSKDGTKLYISNEDVATASVVNLADRRVEQIIRVKNEPEGVALSPNGRFAYITCETGGQVVVIDTTRHKVVAELTVSGPMTGGPGRLSIQARSNPTASRPRALCARGGILTGSMVLARPRTFRPPGVIGCEQPCEHSMARLIRAGSPSSDCLAKGVS